MMVSKRNAVVCSRIYQYFWVLHIVKNKVSQIEDNNLDMNSNPVRESSRGKSASGPRSMDPDPTGSIQRWNRYWWVAGLPVDRLRLVLSLALSKGDGLALILAKRWHLCIRSADIPFKIWYYKWKWQQ